MSRTTARRGRAGTSDAAEREQRRAEQQEKLRAATAALLTSDGWQRWLKTRARFHRYSLHNTMLIALQRPDASHVAGFRRWRELGRCVRRGETGIRILAPVTSRRREADDSDEGNERRLVGFRLAAVFDVSQTDPLEGVEPAPLEPPLAPIEGSSHSDLLGPLERHAASLGYAVSYEHLHAGDGFCEPGTKRIVIEAALEANAQVATLVHELAHAHGITYREYSRAEAELIVESVACIVCGTAGLDTTPASATYLACWNGAASLEAVSRLTTVIDEVARRIEDSLPADRAAATTAQAVAQHAAKP
jgi:antirestriction protein ArdC